jgi:hypothetical protein
VYRVPLVWMMQDSKIDLYVMTQSKDIPDQEQDLIELFTDIQSTFNQCCEDPDIGETIQSKLIELNDDFYTSIDIQGYKCMSRHLAERRPI